MNSEERRDFIIRELEENHTVKILELSKRLKVTRETIRKDLYLLEKKRIDQENSWRCGLGVRKPRNGL